MSLLLINKINYQGDKYLLSVKTPLITHKQILTTILRIQIGMSEQNENVKDLITFGGAKVMSVYVCEVEGIHL